MCSHSEDGSVDGISPTQEDNSAAGFTPSLEVPDRRQVGGPIRLDASNLSMGFSPLQTNFLHVQLDYGYIRNKDIYEGFLVWIIPLTYRSRMV